MHRLYALREAVPTRSAQGQWRDGGSCVLGTEKDMFRQEGKRAISVMSEG